MPQVARGCARPLAVCFSPHVDVNPHENEDCLLQHHAAASAAPRPVPSPQASPRGSGQDASLARQDPGGPRCPPVASPASGSVALHPGVALGLTCISLCPPSAPKPPLWEASHHTMGPHALRTPPLRPCWPALACPAPPQRCGVGQMHELPLSGSLVQGRGPAGALCVTPSRQVPWHLPLAGCVPAPS